MRVICYIGIIWLLKSKFTTVKSSIYIANYQNAIYEFPCVSVYVSYHNYFDQYSIWHAFYQQEWPSTNFQHCLIELVIRNRKSKKNRQYNGQMKRRKKIKQWFKNTTQKTKDLVTWTLLRTVGDVRSCGRVSSSCRVIRHEWGINLKPTTNRPNSDPNLLRSYFSNISKNKTNLQFNLFKQCFIFYNILHSSPMNKARQLFLGVKGWINIDLSIRFSPTISSFKN
jgi:hypothetical protein